MGFLKNAHVEVVSNFSIFLFYLMLILFSANICYAGSSYTSSDQGKPYYWKDNTLKWYVDKGDLSPSVDHDTAVAWVNNMLAQWREKNALEVDHKSIPISNIMTQFMGTLRKDATGNNYQELNIASAGVVIFDTDASIIADLVGPENAAKTPGLTMLLSSDSNDMIFSGYTILNGTSTYLGRYAMARTEQRADELFQATILHELGHLLNLDHAQSNVDIVYACNQDGNLVDRNGLCEGGHYIPSMYPYLVSYRQGQLSRDDIVSLASIYPTDELSNEFCMVTGYVSDAEGYALKGVNIIASRIGEGEALMRVDSRSYVSGAHYPGCTGDSRYVINGLIPGKTYQIYYEPLYVSANAESSGYGPLEQPPVNFNATLIMTADNQSSIKCDQPGTHIEMQTAVIDVSNPCKGTVALLQDSIDSTQSPPRDMGMSGAPGCQLTLYP